MSGGGKGASRRYASSEVYLAEPGAKASICHELALDTEMP